MTINDGNVDLLHGYIYEATPHRLWTENPSRKKGGGLNPPPWFSISEY
jgi:hypothetical protein